MATTTGTGTRPTRTPGSSPLSLLNRREVRQAIYQILIVVALGLLLWMIVSNTITNLRKQNIASGFGFWDTTSGFDISQSLIDYAATASYGRAFWVGLLNTLLVAGIGIVLATIVGFTMGIARLSSNWLIARLATIYVEVARNVPLLLQLFVWYFAVLKNLPDVFLQNAAGEFVLANDGTRLPGSVHIPGGFLLNNRGLYMPRPEWLDGGKWVLAALAASIVASILIGLWARRRRLATGKPFPVFLTALGLIVLAPLAVFILTGRPVTLEYPVLGRFNLNGGIVVLPEFMAVLLGLVFYTGAYIAEVVRSGIQGVPKGQKEAALAIGLSKGQMLRLVVIPQAMRIIIPPLTSQYLNLTKNSSLGVAIAYPELVHVFTGTVLNQTGQAIEVILITMLVYLTFSLSTSMLMNWFNARMALVER